MMGCRTLHFLPSAVEGDGIWAEAWRLVPICDDPHPCRQQSYPLV